MELDEQLEAMLSKSADQLKNLANEKQKLEQENQTLIVQLKITENNKNNIMEAMKESTNQMNAELERKFKLQNDIAKLREEILLTESKNSKQKSINQKYEESMVKQIEDVRRQTAINDEARSKEKEAEESYIATLNNKNDEIQREIENELKAIEQFQVYYIT
jgi:hypothetical protein